MMRGGEGGGAASGMRSSVRGWVSVGRAQAGRQPCRRMRRRRRPRALCRTSFTAVLSRDRGMRKVINCSKVRQRVGRGSGRGRDVCPSMAGSSAGSGWLAALQGSSGAGPQQQRRARDRTHGAQAPRILAVKQPRAASAEPAPRREPAAGRGRGGLEGRGRGVVQAADQGLQRGRRGESAAVSGGQAAAPAEVRRQRSTVYADLQQSVGGMAAPRGHTSGSPGLPRVPTPPR